MIIATGYVFSPKDCDEHHPPSFVENQSRRRRRHRRRRCGECCGGCCCCTTQQAPSRSSTNGAAPPPRIQLQESIGRAAAGGMLQLRRWTPVDAVGKSHAGLAASGRHANRTPPTWDFFLMFHTGTQKPRFSRYGLSGRWAVLLPVAVLNLRTFTPAWRDHRSRGFCTRCPDSSQAQ